MTHLVSEKRSAQMHSHNVFFPAYDFLFPVSRDAAAAGARGGRAPRGRGRGRGRGGPGGPRGRGGR